MDYSDLLRMLLTLLLSLQDEEMKPRYTLEERGQLNTDSFRGFMKADGHYISGVHDIKVIESEDPYVFNMLCEIPRWTNAKMVSFNKEPLNPISQLSQNGKVLYQRHVFPYTGYPFNYGTLPQTYTDPNRRDSTSGLPGDGEFLDIAEIGSKTCKFGLVVRVKVLAILPTVSEGIADWKVIAIRVDDELADKLDGPEDIERYKPGFLDGFKDYFAKQADLSGTTILYPFGGAYQNSSFAEEFIKEINGFWLDCHTGKTTCDISLENTMQEISKFRISQRRAEMIVDRTPRRMKPAEITDPDAEKWYYVEM